MIMEIKSTVASITEILEIREFNKKMNPLNHLFSKDEEAKCVKTDENFSEKINKTKIIMEQTEYTTPDGIYTQKQLDYVDSVKDENLRDHLLHQVRLRDLMEQDRDAFEKESGNKSNIQYAMKILINSFKKDEDYKRSWKDNIAMAFKDECQREFKTNLYTEYGDAEENIHEIANKSADNFLNLLCR